MSQLTLPYHQLISEGEGMLRARRGLNLAVEKADRDNEGWSDRCYSLFLEWLKEKPVGFTFLIEDFRVSMERNMRIETPHSKRAFGIISKRGKAEGLIKWFGYGHVKNPDANHATASVWQKL